MKALKINDVCEMVGFSRGLVYKLIKEGKFPPQYNIPGSTTVVWSEDDINDYLRSIFLKDDQDSPTTRASA